MAPFPPKLPAFERQAGQLMNGPDLGRLRRYRFNSSVINREDSKRIAAATSSALPMRRAGVVIIKPTIRSLICALTGGFHSSKVDRVHT